MTQTHEPQQTGGYEKRDVNIRATLIVAGSIILFIVVSLALLNEYFIRIKERYIQEMVLAPESLSLRDLRAREDQLLNGYELIDSTAGTYRIPVERAMELEVEEAYRDTKR